MEPIQFPHCDSRVIHSQSDHCKYCDESGLQQIREMWGIAYTGHSDEEEEFYDHRLGRLSRRKKIPCPSERDRPVETIHKWPGNRPYQDAEAEVPPVDYNARELTDGSPVTDDHREINPLTGQQKGYVVLNAEERSKGFVRPVRRTYTHIGKGAKFDGGVLLERGVGGCGTNTSMALSIAETFARTAGSGKCFYDGTFCATCCTHLPLNEFVWEGTSEIVGS